MVVKVTIIDVVMALNIDMKLMMSNLTLFIRDQPKPLSLVSAVAESGPKLNIQLRP